jgi:hypothetical protein
MLQWPKKRGKQLSMVCISPHWKLMIKQHKSGVNWWFGRLSAISAYHH